MLATQATAQDLLDLDTPEAPEVGEKAAALLLAETLEAQADGLIAGGAPASAEIRAEVRRLAADLLRTGQAAGDDGASRLLAGRTIAGALQEFDAAAGGEWADEVARTLALGDLRRARTRLASPDADPDRTLRDALWRLAERADDAPKGVGWAERHTVTSIGAEEARDAAALLRDLGAGGEWMDGVDRLLDLADEAAERRAFEASAARVRGLLVGAARALEDPPRWVSQEQQRAGAMRVAQAAAAMLDAPRRAEGRDRLARYAALAPLIRRADAMERTNDVRALRERLAAALADPPEPTTLDALTQAMDLLDAVEVGERDEKTLARRLRPAWRWCRRSGVLAARSLTERLPSIADTPSPLTDPGVLSDLAAAREPLDVGRALIDLSDRLDQDPDGPADKPETSGVGERIATRVLRVARDLDDSESGPAARAMILRLADDLRRADALERIEVPRLRSMVEATRAAVYEAWGADEDDDGPDPDEARAGMTRLERVSAWLDAADAMRRVGEGGSLAQAWAAFELSPAAASALQDGLGDDVKRLLSAAELADLDRVDAMLGELDRRHAGPALVGAIERGLRERVGGDSPERAGGALAQLAYGPPDERDAWLVDQRARLAVFCARAEELAAASIRDDRPAVTDLRDALRTSAEALLRAIERR